LVPSFESMDAMEKRLDSLHTCSCSCSIKPYTAHRVVAEKNGTLVITTDNEAEEIRERLEKEEPPASPLEETTEFADLLQKKNIE
jgi:hypothetical protein